MAFALFLIILPLLWYNSLIKQPKELLLLETKKRLVALSNRIFIALLLFVVLSVALSSLLSPLADSPAAKGLVSLCVYVAAISLALIVAKGKDEHIIPLKLPVRFALGKQTVFFFGVCFVSTTLTLLTTYLLSLIGVSPAAETVFPLDGATDVLLSFLKYVFFSALLEEILFRKVILSSLRPFGDGFAVVVSSLLFASSHFSLASFPSVFVFGLFFGYLFCKTGSVIPSTVFHFLNNLLAFLLAVIKRSSPESYEKVSAYIVVFFAFCAIISVLYIIIKKDLSFIRILSSRQTSWKSFFFTLPSAVWLLVFVYLTLKI